MELSWCSGSSCEECRAVGKDGRALRIEGVGVESEQHLAGSSSLTCRYAG